MLEGVVDEVAERLLDAERIRVERDVVARLDPDVAVELAGAQGEALAHPVEHLGCVEPLRADRQPALVCPRKQQQVLGEPGQPFGLLGRRMEGLLELVARARPPQGQVELGAEQGERR